MIKIFPDIEEKIVSLYVSDKLSAREIKDILDIEVSSRQIQRILKRRGVIRTVGESFSLAVSQGKVKYHRVPSHLKKVRKSIQSKLRYQILSRDNFRCVICGATAADVRRLEVDHINGDHQDNNPDNLQTLCDLCNKGKFLNSQ